MIRLSTAHAKARISKLVTAQDAHAAIELIQYAHFKKVLEKEKKRRRRESQSEESEDEEAENGQRTKRTRRAVSFFYHAFFFAKMCSKSGQMLVEIPRKNWLRPKARPEVEGKV